MVGSATSCCDDNVCSFKFRMKYTKTKILPLFNSNENYDCDSLYITFYFPFLNIPFLLDDFVRFLLVTKVASGKSGRI